MNIIAASDIVMCKVMMIQDSHVIVCPLEMDDVHFEAMLAVHEISRTRIKSLRKEISVGAIEPMTVLAVDFEKRFMDVSKKRVTDEEAVECKERYRKIKGVHALVHSLSITTGLSKDLIRSLLDIDPSDLDDLASIYDTISLIDTTTMDKRLCEDFKDYVQRKFTLPTLLHTVYFNLIPETCDDFQPVQKALISLSEKYPQIILRLVTSPTYSIAIDGIDEKETKALLKSYLEKDLFSVLLPIGMKTEIK